MNEEIHNPVTVQDDYLPFTSLPDSDAYKRPLSDFSHHTNYKEFENKVNLDEIQIKVVLRILKKYFEQHLGHEVPDELFIDIIKLFPYLSPRHPLASPYARLGYTIPLQKLMDKYEVEYDISRIMSFFWP